MKKVCTAVIAAFLLTSHVSALHVKVLSVDQKSRSVTVLLPVHHATVEAQLAPEEPSLEVRANEYYEAELERGKVNTVKRNWLYIKVSRKKTVKFRLRKVTFHD